MKIIKNSPNEADYYDSVANTAGESDNSIVYLRTSTSIEINVDHRNKTYKPEQFPVSKLYYNRSYPNTTTSCSCEINIIGFCGRTYVVGILIKGQDVTYSYEFIEIVGFINTNFSTRNSKFGYRRNDDIAFISDLFNKWHDIEHTDLFHKLNVPIFVVVVNDRTWYRTSAKLITNPILKSYEFYKIKDAYTAFQDVESFISGVLTNTEVNSIPLTEKQHVISHGFDPKYGFRKRKKTEG